MPGARSETPYVVLSAIFWAGLLAAARLGRERLSEPTSAVDLVALGLAGTKIGRIVAEDRVTVFLRRPFAGGPAAVQPAGDGMRRAIGELVTCPHFVSVYQLHLVDARVPVEESVGEHDLARARATADVVSVKKRYSLVEQRSLPVLERCERDGLAFIAWAPLGKGFLAAGSGTLRRVATRHGATAGQVALAWVLRSPAAFPIPGTASVSHLEETLTAAGARAHGRRRRRPRPRRLLRPPRSSPRPEGSSRAGKVKATVRRGSR